MDSASSSRYPTRSPTLVDIHLPEMDGHRSKSELELVARSTIQKLETGNSANYPLNHSSTDGNESKPASLRELDIENSGNIGKEEIAPEDLDEEVEHDGEVVDFPDGGWRAWLVIAGAGHVLFASVGFTNTWGVFQEYYESELFPEQSSSAIAWIGSMQYCLNFLPSLIMGRLVDIGKFQWPFYIAAVIYPVSAIITAEVKEYWQAILVHGILFGLSGGILFGPAMAIAGHWFLKRRALAFGIVAGSSSIGGATFPVLVHNCIHRIGFPWTMRICGFILAYATLFASLTLKPRLPPKNVKGGLFNPTAFKAPAYAFYVLGSFLVMLGLYTPLSYFSVTGTAIGLGDFSSYLISIANTLSFAGRLGTAVFADRVGPVNLLIPGLLGSAATTFAWPFCLSMSSLTAIAALNGMFQGTFVSLFAPGVAQLGSTDDLGRRLGMLSSILGIGCLLGPPISGAILSSTGSFHAVSYYAAITVLAGLGCFVASRWFVLRQMWGKM